MQFFSMSKSVINKRGHDGPGSFTRAKIGHESDAFSGIMMPIKGFSSFSSGGHFAQ